MFMNSWGPMKGTNSGLHYLNAGIKIVEMKERMVGMNSQLPMGVAETVDVLVLSPSQGDGVNVQISEGDNAGTDLHDSPEDISEEDEKDVSEASQHLSSSH